MYFPCPELKPGSQINSLKSASKQAEMSKAKLQQLSPVQQRKAAAILGALVADSASKEAPSHHYVHTPVIAGYIFTLPPPGPPHYYLTPLQLPPCTGSTTRKRSRGSRPQERLHLSRNLTALTTTSPRVPTVHTVLKYS